LSRRNEIDCLSCQQRGPINKLLTATRSAASHTGQPTNYRHVYSGGGSEKGRGVEGIGDEKGGRGQGCVEQGRDYGCCKERRGRNVRGVESEKEDMWRQEVSEVGSSSLLVIVSGV
jgi:hypothetical protein